MLGRTNYEGFYAVWPDMTRDPSTDPRTRDVGRWLDATEKVVISRTLTDAPWETRASRSTSPVRSGACATRPAVTYSSSTAPA